MTLMAGFLQILGAAAKLQRCMGSIHELGQITKRYFCLNFVKFMSVIGSLQIFLDSLSARARA
jgi:hypothetical protein